MNCGVADSREGIFFIAYPETRKQYFFNIIILALK